MKGNRRRSTVILSFQRPEGASPRECARYIRRALMRFGGGGDPEDPLFAGLDVQIHPMPPKKNVGTVIL